MRQASTDVAHPIAPPDILANLADFEAHLRAGNRSPMTIRVYGQAVRELDSFLTDRGMPRAVANIRREHVEAFIEDQLRRLRPATAANRYRSLQQFFRWCVDEGEIGASPMAKMRPPTIPEEPPAILRDDQLDGLLKVTGGSSFEDRRDRAILSLLMDTGMRRAELTGLRLADVDLDEHRNVATVMGKGRRPRACPFGNNTAKDLRRYLRARKQRDDASSPWLWLGKRGRLTENGVAQMLRRRGAEAGVGDLHPHLFRHLFAHQMLSAGMQEGDLMRLAGWKSRQMLSRYGASAADERARDAYREMSPRDRR
jgi:site-specific recombinase XerD